MDCEGLKREKFTSWPEHLFLFCFVPVDGPAECMQPSITSAPSEDRIKGVHPPQTHLLTQTETDI